jgi:tRNA-Thr(GGU) m(6)t(6)A37 methyltransferase TsaA
MDFLMHPIGVIHTPFKTVHETPIQYKRSQAAGEVEIYPEFETGLEGIDGFSHLMLIYAFHIASPNAGLMVKPLLDDEKHGVFATRYFCRPNPLGFSVVRLVNRKGSFLQVECVDMLDGTPLLDVKPYVPEFDEINADRIGWYSNRAFQ